MTRNSCRNSRKLLAFFIGLVCSVTTFAADLQETQKLFRRGECEKCIDIAKGEVERSVWNEGWPKLLVEAYLATGEYEEAVKAYEAGVQRFSTSLRLRMLGAQAYRMTDNAKQARAVFQAIPELIQRVPGRFTSRSEMVALGEYFLVENEDPKQVLELCFDKVIKEDPKFVEAYVASARLALNKNDDQVALASLKKAVALDKEDPEIFYLLARAWSSTDSEKSSEYIRQALSLNPKHIPSLLWLAELKLDAEAYDLAEEILSEIESINPKLPNVWALRAAIAHLQGKFEKEGEARRKALIPWPLNPEVDHLIGKNLADHYRFAESVEYQRRALVMQENYAPARTQLAQDLLRLGQLDEGWKMVEQVRKNDAYDVSIFNLAKLRARLEKFATLEAPGFIVRMDATEAKIYGQSVINLLSEARDVLTEKYGSTLEEPVYVEIFPKQSDFAIRTFGLPGGDGFLGVCFGRLITANSPAALQSDSNWQSVLWHEYCHVVTLQKTKNRMPRWLSEGISVYEERQRDPRWGQGMTPTYRQMILGEDFTPVSQLSGAFLRPKSPMHLQFAYFEASLVIEYWMKEYGIKSMQKLLDDLSVGMPMEEALGRRAGGIQALDADFQSFARDLANQYGGGLTFDDLDEERPADIDGLKAYLAEHPNDYKALNQYALLLVRSKQSEEALAIVKRIAEALPEDVSPTGGPTLLTVLYRNLERDEELYEALVQLQKMSPDCIEELSLLIEIDREKKSYELVKKWCDLALQIDPLRSSIHELRAEAAELIDQPEAAIESLLALNEMAPRDIAGVHFRLAKNLIKLKSRQEAKRHLLMALEESPRFREALSLLLEMNRE
jgi:tetratricopeptide (TPR) repeat protein